MDNPESLFHYTTEAGLKGILESNHLWATDFRHLNDRKEIIFFSDLITDHCLINCRSYFTVATKHLNIRNENDALYGLSKGASDQIIQPLLNPQLQPFYVLITSFTEHKDAYHKENGLLSMWRSYGNVSYAIEFDFTRLSEALKTYESDDKIFRTHYVESVTGLNECDQKLINEYFEVFVRAEILKYDGKTECALELLKKFLDNTKIKSIFRALASYKHIGFQEENEHRIAIFNNADCNRIHFRDGFVPYMKIFEEQSANEQPFDISTAIKKILIGPSTTSAQKYEHLSRYLSCMGKEISVQVSKTPYK